MHILAISGSAREQSFNTHLARMIGAARPGDQVSVITDLDVLPFYNADVEAMDTPSPVARLREAIAAADAVVFVTPEYNGTIPGLLGNAIDWLSRPFRQSVLANRTILVLSASPSRLGGARAAEHLRSLLTRIGGNVVSTGIAVPLAHERLHGPSADAELVAELTELLGESFGAMEPASLHRDASAA